MSRKDPLFVTFQFRESLHPDLLELDLPVVAGMVKHLKCPASAALRFHLLDTTHVVIEASVFKNLGQYLQFLGFSESD